jgi:HipA-like kinase
LVENVDELTYLFIEQADVQLRARILLFDWWVCNGDRTLSPDGGNPNLLWSHYDRKLHVIDQTLAFDPDVAAFWDQHIFRANLCEWTPAFREEISRTMRAALSDVPQWWREMPEDWTETETGLTLDGARKLLSRFDENSRTFWRAT